nr:hypothetical protein [uncultured Kingella sp.]
MPHPIPTASRFRQPEKHKTWDCFAVFAGWALAAHASHTRRQPENAWATSAHPTATNIARIRFTQSVMHPNVFRLPYG